MQVESAVVLIGERKGKRIQVGIQFGLVLHHLRILGDFRRTEQIFCHRIEQDNLGRIVGNDNRVADVLDDQIKAIAILAHNFFGSAELLQIGTDFFIGAPQVSYVTHHGDHTGANCFFAEGGSGDGFEKDLFAFHDIHQGKIARGATGTDYHRGQGGGEQQVVQLHRPLSSLADTFRDTEETLRRLILGDYTMLTVGEDDRIGHALHYRLQARNRYLHVTHAVVVMLHLEQAREVTVGSCGERPQLLQMCLTGVLVQLGEHQRGIGLHAAGSTDLIFELQFPGNSRILDRQAILSPFPFCLPTASGAAVDHGVCINGTATDCVVRQYGRIGILQGGDDRILAGPERSTELRQIGIVTIQRSSRFHFPGFEIHFQYHCPGETQLDDFLKENGENFLWAFGGEQSKSCRLIYGIARNEYLRLGP